MSASIDAASWRPRRGRLDSRLEIAIIVGTNADAMQATRMLTEVTPMPAASTRRPFLATVAGASGAALTLTRPRRATAQTPVTVKYLTWWWAEKGRNEAWRGIVRKFHDAQKDIRVQEVGFPY